MVCRHTIFSGAYFAHDIRVKNGELVGRIISKSATQKITKNKVHARRQSPVKRRK
jgi:hypothetical protein